MSRALLVVAAVAVLFAGLYALERLGPEMPAADAGEIRLLRVAGPEFDRFIADPSPELEEQIADSYWRMRGFPPFFDRALSYAPPTFLSINAYGIPAREGGGIPKLIREHPDWVLRDGEGEPLFIPFGCEQGRCPQYAADFGDQGWRDHLIGLIGERMAAGYAGVHVDDVNMEWRVSDGSSEFTRPADPRTGAPMTLPDWQRYMADFMVQIRESFPDAEFSQNPLWFAGHDAPEVQRQLEAADYIELERGYSDPGLVPGSGRFGFDRLLDHVDWLHDHDLGVITEPYELDEAGAEFELATAFLVADGNDAVAADWGTLPGQIWPGWKLDLGPPQNDRYRWQGLWRRDFDGGIVLVNPTGEATVEADLDGDYTDLSGTDVDSVRLDGGRAAVLERT